MSEEIYCRTINELQGAVTDAFMNTERLFPALLLLYASMDIISSLTRPITKADTSGPVFRKWVDTYMLPGSGLNCTSDDLWAARCGILHTLSIESRLSSQGVARQICYINRKDGVANIQAKIDPSWKKNVVVSTRHLAQSFLKGTLNFSKEIESTESLRALVYQQVAKLAVVVRFKMA